MMCFCLTVSFCVAQSSVQHHGKKESSEDSEVWPWGQHRGLTQGDDEPDLWTAAEYVHASSVFSWNSVG